MLAGAGLEKACVESFVLEKACKVCASRYRAPESLILDFKNSQRP